jgi:hypothetical protein
MRAKPAARPIYNSALKGREWAGRDEFQPIDFAESARGMVFAHNICEPLPDAMAERIARVECFYSEVPWPAARDTFYQRSGVEPRPHAEYQAAIKGIIDRFKKPTFIIAAKRDAFALAADDVRLISLYGDPGWLAIRGGRPPECRTNQELIARLAEAYGSVYDFSCGCGVALRPFAYFIGSDIDRKCLAYVQRELLSGGGAPDCAR